MKTKHRYKSIDGAVRRIRELTRSVKDRDDLLKRWSHELKMLAKLASESPQFYNPLDVVEAKRIRDGILNPMQKAG